MGLVNSSNTSSIAMAVQSCLEEGSDYGVFLYNKPAMNLYGLLGDGYSWGNGTNQYSYNNWSYSKLAGGEDASAYSASQIVDKLGSGNWQVDGDKAVPKMGNILTDNPWYSGAITAEDMVKTLGSGWEVVGGKAVPKVTAAIDVDMVITELLKALGENWIQDGETIVPKTTSVTEPSYDPIAKPTLPDFYHTNNGKIEKTLMTETRQSSVVLSWDTDGNMIDYFTVLRREVGKGDDAWEEIATNIDNLSYEDKTVSPVKNYEYKVRAVNDCEGITFSETTVKEGHCKNTGRVAGYVRFNDGTGAAKVKVTVVDEETSKELATVTTDASGHFVADELPYKEGGQSTTYRVQPINIKTKQGEDAASVTFDSKSNDATLRDFIIIDGKRFSGIVYYEGTSIPVKGARFLVNGLDVYNSANKFVETEYDGSFSFRVRSGVDTIQIKMDGHEFVNNGYFKGPEGHNFGGDVADIRFLTWATR